SLARLVIVYMRDPPYPPFSFDSASSLDAPKISTNRLLELLATAAFGGSLDNVCSDLAMHVGKARSVADQATGLDELPAGIDRRHCIARRQRQDLHPTILKQCLGCDKNRVCSLLDEACEGDIDLASVAGTEHLDDAPHGLGRPPRVF